MAVYAKTITEVKIRRLSALPAAEAIANAGPEAPSSLIQATIAFMIRHCTSSAESLIANQTTLGPT